MNGDILLTEDLFYVLIYQVDRFQFVVVGWQVQFQVLTNCWFGLTAFLQDKFAHASNIILICEFERIYEEAGGD